MRVLVTGGTGFVGSHVVERLATENHEVVVLTRAGAKHRFLATLPNVSRVVGGLEDAVALRKATKGVQAIVHCAGAIRAKSPSDYETANVVGTANLLRAASRLKNLRRFVFVSSLAAVGPGRGSEPRRASDPPRPISAYGRSKLRAEGIVQEVRERVPVVILRPPMVYGPRDTSTLRYLQAIRMRVLPILVREPRAPVSVVHAADLAISCIRAIDADVASGSCFHVSDGQTYTWLELMHEAERALGVRAILRRPLPESVLNLAAFANEMVGAVMGTPSILTSERLRELSATGWWCDSEPARAQLDWEARIGWREGIQGAIAWYRREGMLA